MAINFLSAIAVDSDVLYTDTTNNRVGIGTTSPAQKLDVVGSAQITNDIYLGRYIFHDGDTNTWLGFPLDDTISFRTNGLDRMYITSAGNVGIGTTSPSTLLTLESNSQAPYPGIDIKSTSTYPGSEIRFLNSAGSEVSVIESYNNPGRQDITMRYTLSSTGGKCELQDNAAILAAGTSGLQSYLQVGITDFRVITNYGTRMYINTLGNVGVGTTSPQRKFHVNGIARIEANGQTLDLVGTDHSYIGFYPDGVSAGRKAYIGFPGSIINRLTISNEFDDDISFFTNGSEKVTIENSGNVGIGTTSPALKLEVEGGDALLQLSTASSTGNPYMTFSQAGTRRSFIQHRDSGDNLKIASEYGSISLFTGTGGTETERITILSGGNVGIGTTSPQAKLDVNGGVRVGNDSTTASAANAGTLRYYTSGNNSYVDMCMQTGASTYAWVNIVTNSW